MSGGPGRLIQPSPRKGDRRERRGQEGRQEVDGCLPFVELCVCVCVCLWLAATLLSSSIACNGGGWYLL